VRALSLNPPRAAKKLYPVQVEDALVAEFGLTDDPLEAGYVLSDGRMLDFSGKKEGGQPGTRSYDHREVGRASRKGTDIPGGTEGMLWVMATTGALRVSFFADSIQIDAEGVKPTAAQARVIERAWHDLGRPSNVNIDWGSGEGAALDVFSPSQIREALMTRSNPRVLKCQNCGDRATMVLTDQRGKQKWSACDPCRYGIWGGSNIVRFIDKSARKPFCVCKGPGHGECRNCALGRKPCTCEGCQRKARPKESGAAIDSGFCGCQACADGKGTCVRKKTRRNFFLPDGASDALSAVDWSHIRKFPGGPLGYARYAASEVKRRVLRRNPSLMLVTGNPPPAMEAVRRAWCKFHQKDSYTGTTRNIGAIPGAPQYAMALGRLHAIDLGKGSQQFSPKPWLVYAPDDQSLWIVSEEPMNVGAAASSSIKSVTYDPMKSSGKEPAYYKHEFNNPHPSFCPVGNAKRCRAILLEGGVYRVKDWIYD
jgi:hypothetical protein